ncbi:MAG: hypothetical protein KY475_07010 [Planctomycetes bacterium]|nr:hypothetical protein [Planctomycetota bacterium]
MNELKAIRAGGILAASVVLLACGCSLIGGDDGPAPVPPMIGASADNGPPQQVRRRPKIRFASEISNVRKERAAAKAMREAAESYAGAAAMPAGAPYPVATPQPGGGPPPYSTPFAQRLPAVQPAGYSVWR